MDSFNALPGFDFSKWKFLWTKFEEKFSPCDTRLEIMSIEVIFIVGRIITLN